MLCWQRGQESRRNELRAAARALPAASELLAIPRQRLDGAAGALPRALKANTHAHFRRFASVSARLTVRVLRGQVAQATHRLTVSGERLAHSARSLLRHRRDRYRGTRDPAESLETLQRAGAAPGHRARPRTGVAAGRARAARARNRHCSAMQARVAHSGQLLAALSYRSVLARGFALVRDAQGHAVHAAGAIGPVRTLSIEFADGRVGATADADRPAATPPAKPVAGEPKAVSAQARRQAGRPGKPVLSWISSPRQPFRDALLRIGAGFGVGAEMAVLRPRASALRRSRAPANWRDRNRDRRRDRPRSAPARCGRARRRSSGGRRAAN